MTLPIDAIVAIYYSGSVNVASTNNQSTITALPAIAVTTKHDKRLWQHFDSVFNVPGLADILSIFDSISVHKFFNKSITESLSLSDSVPIRSIRTIISDVLSLKGKVRLGSNPGLGTGNYVQLNAIQTFTRAMTVTAWVKFISCDNAGYGGIISCINGFFGNRLLLNEDQTTILFQLANATSGIQSCSYATGFSFANHWHHFGGSWDGANMQIYLDGVAVGSPVQLGGTLLSGSTKPLIGAGTSSNQFFFGGNIAELALYNVALTPTEITKVYTNGASTVTRGQLSYYKINEGNGQTVKDSGPSNISGTLVNGPLWSPDYIKSDGPMPGDIIDTVVRLKIKIITDTLALASSVARLVGPRIFDSGISIQDVVTRAKQIFFIESLRVLEGGGFSSGFTAGFSTVNSVTIKVIPHVATETLSLAGTVVRTILKSLTEPLHISDGIARVKARFISIATESLSLADTNVRKVLPKLAAESLSVIDSKVRKILPHLAAESLTVADSNIIRKKPTLAAESLSIIDSLIRRRVVSFIESLSQAGNVTRRALPHVTTESLSVQDAMTKLAHHFRSLSESITAAESNVIRIIPIIASERVTQSGTVARLRTVTRALTETLSQAGSITRLVLHSITESLSEAGSLLRLPIPHIADSLVIVTAQINRRISRSVIESLSDADSLIRRSLFAFTEHITVSDSKVIKKLIMITQSLSQVGAVAALTSRFRSVTEGLSVQDSLLRRVIPKILTQSLTQTGTVSTFKGAMFTINESLSLAGNITRRRVVSLTESLSDIDSKVIRVYRSLLEAITDTDTKQRKVIPKLATESLSASDTNKIKILHKIIESLSVADTIVRRAGRAVTETARLSDAVKLLVARKPLTESISFVETKVIRTLKFIVERLTIGDSVGRPGIIQSTRTVIYNINKGLIKSTRTVVYTTFKGINVGGPSGGAGWGTADRPFRLINYVRDYTMRYRRRWKGNY